jgi:hypothetical protein
VIRVRDGMHEIVTDFPQRESSPDHPLSALAAELLRRRHGRVAIDTGGGRFRVHGF